MKPRLVGIAVWVALLAALGGAVGGAATSQSLGPPIRTLARFWTTASPTVSLTAPAGLVTAQTPVFHHDAAADRWQQIGVVQSVSPAEPGIDQAVEVRWFGQSLPSESLQWQAHSYRGSMNETLALLLPPPKRQRLQTLVHQSLQAHAGALATQFQPLLERSLRESLPVIEQQLMASLQQRRPELQQIRSRWRDQWADEALPQLAKEQVWPIVQRHSDPLAYDIGRELWNRASLWSFTWRAVYDRSPLPRRDLMREEWERFASEEAIPVLESHADEIAAALRAILGDLATNPVVRQELGEGVDALLNDPQTRTLIGGVLRDTLVDNPALHQVWVAVWTSDEALQALDHAGRLAEPLVRQIGEAIFGSPETGIDPGFARVLRSQILGKDKRWIVVQAASHDALPAAASSRVSPPHASTRQRIVPATAPAAYPLLPSDGWEFE